jgi:hypothetical protein
MSSISEYTVQPLRRSAPVERREGGPAFFNSVPRTQAEEPQSATFLERATFAPE